MPSPPNGDRHCALYHACAYCTARDPHLATIRTLLGAGATVNKPHPHAALRLLRNLHSPPQALALLIAHGLDLAYRADDMFHAAALHSHAALTLLLSAGLRPPDCARTPVLSRLLLSEFQARLRLGPRPPEDLAAVMRTLLSLGARTHESDSYGHTVLHLAVRRDSVPLEPLIEAGANLEARNAEGNTPLLEAARLSSWQSLRWLLLAGADLEARNAAGNTVATMWKKSHYWRVDLPQKVKIA